MSVTTKSNERSDNAATTPERPSPTPRLRTADTIKPSPRPRPRPQPRSTPAPSPEGDEYDESTPPNVLLRFVRAIPLALVAVLVVVLAVAGPTVILYLEQRQTGATEAARTTALDAARQRVPQMLSYSHESLDKDLAEARNAVTDPFEDEFDELLRTAVRPSAMTDQISTRTTVSAAGVVRADEHDVVVLLFINQLTKTNSQEEPRIDGARVRVTMHDVNGEWLVSRLDSV